MQMISNKPMIAIQFILYLKNALICRYLFSYYGNIEVYIFYS